MDYVIIDLMTNFLTKNFPIKRIKSGRYFKLGVDIDGNHFFLPSNTSGLKLFLSKLLKDYYSCSDEEVNIVISDVYNI